MTTLSRPLSPSDPAPSGTPHPILGEASYDFFRCDRCFALVTQTHLTRALASGGKIKLCPCGGLKIRPTNPHWHEYLLPRVLAFAWARAQALGWRQVVANVKADWRRWRAHAAE